MATIFAGFPFTRHTPHPQAGNDHDDDGDDDGRSDSRDESNSNVNVNNGHDGDNDDSDGDDSSHGGYDSDHSLFHEESSGSGWGSGSGSGWSSGGGSQSGDRFATASVAKIQKRQKQRQKTSLRKGMSAKGKNSLGGGTVLEGESFRAGAATSASPPLSRTAVYGAVHSYFDSRHGGGGFSVANEWHCFARYILRLREAVEEDRLPWATDFFDMKKMRRPRNGAEAVSRLNLNIPYYAANYLEICYAVTFPFLFFYNWPFFVVLVTSCVLVHSIEMRKQQTHSYGTAAAVFGRRVGYHTLGHLLLGCCVILFAFFGGLKTVSLVLLLTGGIVIPHALLRRTTFFDDEEMEKCRPKLLQYALTIVFLALCYLEGAPAAPDPASNASPPPPTADANASPSSPSSPAAKAAKVAKRTCNESGGGDDGGGEGEETTERVRDG